MKTSIERNQRKTGVQSSVGSRKDEGGVFPGFPQIFGRIIQYNTPVFITMYTWTKPST